MNDYMFKDVMDHMVIYAQKESFPLNDKHFGEMSHNWLSVGLMNQSEVRGRINMSIEIFTNNLYSNTELSECGYHSAFNLSDDNPSDNVHLIAEAQKRGYSLPNGFDPVLCGILVPKKDFKIPDQFERIMQSFFMKKYF